MSTFFNDIRAALDIRLSVMPSLPPVAYENIEYDESDGTLYLRPYLLQGDTDQASLGTDGKDMTNGIYQLNVHVPAAAGRSTIIDSIADHFKRGTVLTYNGINLRITGVSVSPALKDINFYITPLSIGYQVFTPART